MRLFQPYERVEERRALRHVDAAAGIAHREPRHARCDAHDERDGAFFGRELDGVVQQV